MSVGCPCISVCVAWKHVYITKASVKKKKFLFNKENYHRYMWRTFN